MSNYQQASGFENNAEFAFGQIKDEKTDVLFHKLRRDVMDKMYEAFCASRHILNLPFEIPEWAFKEILFYNGTGCFTKFNGMYIFGHYYAEKWDIYNEPLQGYIIPKWGNKIPFNFTNSVIIYNSYKLHYPVYRYIHGLCNAIASAEISLYNALHYSGYGIVITSENLTLDDKQAVYDIMHNRDGLKILHLADGKSIQDLNSEQRIKFMQGMELLKQQLYNDAYNFLGISTEIIKSNVQQTEAEIEPPITKEPVLNKHKTLLLEGIRRCNIKFDLNMKVI